MVRQKDVCILSILHLDNAFVVENSINAMNARIRISSKKNPRIPFGNLDSAKEQLNSRSLPPTISWTEIKN